MADPDDCLHCQISDLVSAYMEQHVDDHDDIFGQTLCYLAQVAGDLIASSAGTDQAAALALIETLCHETLDRILLLNMKDEEEANYGIIGHA